MYAQKVWFNSSADYLLFHLDAETCSGMRLQLSLYAVHLHSEKIKRAWKEPSFGVTFSFGLFDSA